MTLGQHLLILITLVQYESSDFDGLNMKKMKLFNEPKLLIPTISKALNEKNNGNKIKQIVYQLEKGEKTEKVHYQGFL